jgi:hypothetical protein
MEKIALVEMKGEVFDVQAATKRYSSLSCNQSLCSVVLVKGTNSFNFKFSVFIDQTFVNNLHRDVKQLWRKLLWWK